MNGAQLLMAQGDSSGLMTGPPAYTDAIVEQCESLKTFPMRGARRDDIRPGLRVFGFRRRVSIAFEIVGEVVTILGIFYGGQTFETAFDE